MSEMVDRRLLLRLMDEANMQGDRVGDLLDEAADVVEAMERIAGLSMSQFASASDMAAECVRLARKALEARND